MASSGPGRLGDPDDLRVALELAEDLLAERVGDLSVDPRVLDVAVSQVVGDVLDAAAGVEEVDRDRVTQGVDRTRRDARRLGVASEEGLDHPLLQGPLAASEETRAGVPPDAEVGAEQLRRVSPEGLLAAQAILQPRG